MPRIKRKYKPLSNLGKDIRDNKEEYFCGDGIKILYWDIIQLEIELHMNKYRSKVSRQKNKNKKLKSSANWEAKKSISNQDQGINLNE